MARLKGLPRLERQAVMTQPGVLFFHVLLFLVVRFVNKPRGELLLTRTDPCMQLVGCTWLSPQCFQARDGILFYSIIGKHQ